MKRKIKFLTIMTIFLASLLMVSVHSATATPYYDFKGKVKINGVTQKNTNIYIRITAYFHCLTEIDQGYWYYYRYDYQTNSNGYYAMNKIYQQEDGYAMRIYAYKFLYISNGYSYYALYNKRHDMHTGMNDIAINLQIYSQHESGNF